MRTPFGAHAAALFLVVAFAAAPARAGDCPVCEDGKDCAADFFCVLHDGDVGCGDLQQLCCPGQGCAVDAWGRPSCEAAGTCTVVASEDATDAGPRADAGAGGDDDAGAGGDDDAGAADDDGDAPGCACALLASSAATPFAAAALVAGALLRRRRTTLR